jgi:expansin (peptidoglycan-binding protein)
MEFKVSETSGTQTSNVSLGYAVTHSSGGVYDVNVTLTSGAVNENVAFVVDSNNATVLSATVSGYTFTGSQAKMEFDDTMALFGLEETFGGAISVYTAPAYFTSTGTVSKTFGTATFDVTTWVAKSTPLQLNACGITSTVTAYTLEVGTPPGTSLLFITYLHIETTSPTVEDITFQLVSMTVG